MTSFAIQTFGCRVNQAEALNWADFLQSHGLRYSDDSSKSDWIIVNSCTLTSKADRDVRAFIRRTVRKNSSCRMIVTGCYAEREYDKLVKMPQVFEVVRNKDKKDLPGKILAEVSEGKKSVRTPFRSRALVKIQDGCDFRCSFCIIPFVRGRSVSVPERDIIRQIRRFIQQGYREIVLTGVHLCLYGKDLFPRSRLLTLLQRIENLEGLGRIRLSSLDPRFMDEEILEHISRSEKICPHFHLSFQHGSNRILRRMGRNISLSDYKRVLFKLQSQRPEAGVGCDIMVGFPGESEKDFEKTALFLEESPLSYFHVFSYSPRPGTVAADWPQVDSRLKKERAALLRRLSLRKNMEFRRQRLGKIEKSIVIQNKGIGAAQVLTGNYINVLVDSCSFEERDEVDVKLIYTDAIRTRGEITI